MNSRLGSQKLVLLGDTFVGKSSLVLRFMRGQFQENLESTVGAAFVVQTVITMGKSIKFEIWDTAGQERYRSLAPMYYRGAKAAIIMYDITNIESFECAKGWVDELHLKAPTVEVIAFAANKIDLEEFRKVSKKDGEEFAQRRGIIFIELTVKNSVNVNEIFIEIAKKLPPSVEISENIPSSSIPSIESLSRTESKPLKSYCC